MTSLPFMARQVVSALAACATLALAATSAHAATNIGDPTGDFLGTYSGPQGGDLDVHSVGAFDDGTDVTLMATLNGDVGTTVGGLYVFGVNRGAGVQGLLSGTPPVGAGVVFDAVVVLFPSGFGEVLDFDGITPTVHPLAAGAVTVDGASIKAVVPLSFLPTNGLTDRQYGYNLWPRRGLNTNADISDFAPGARDFTASVPEPAAWALMIVGFGLTGAALRRRSLAAATPAERRAV